MIVKLKLELHFDYSSKALERIQLLSPKIMSAFEVIPFHDDSVSQQGNNVVLPIRSVMSFLLPRPSLSEVMITLPTLKVPFRYVPSKVHLLSIPSRVAKYGKMEKSRELYFFPSLPEDMEQKISTEAAEGD